MTRRAATAGVGTVKPWTPASRSSARGSPAWPRRSACAGRGATTSWCSSATRRSAARGGTTRTPAAPATSPRTCTRSPSRPTRTGRTRSPPSPRSSPTCSASPTSTTCGARSACAPRSSRPTWDEEAGRWVLATSAGTVRARFLIAGQGPLNEPRLPDIPGWRRFAGAAFHSARWDHGHDLRGRRVAVIGTGASAIQFVPAIQPEVGRAARLPAHRAVGDAAHEPPDLRARARALPARARAAEARPRRRLRRARGARRRARQAPGGCCASSSARGSPTSARRSPTPSCGARSRPTFRLGCKRILPSDDWYPALRRPNVELVTDRIAEVRAHAIVTADGDGARGRHDHLRHGLPRRRHAGRRVGRAAAAGTTLADAWQGSPKAYLGTATAGFPNLFLLLGPNTGLGHTSVVYMMESQLEYVLGALRAARRRASVEVRPEAQAAFTAEIDRADGAHRVGERLRELVPGRDRAATRRSGPTGRGASGAARGPSSRRSSRSCPRRRRPQAGGGVSARVLITGARGGIGTAATEALRARGATVLGPRPRGRRRRRARLRRARPGGGRRRGRGGDRAARRPRRADQQRRARHAAERRRGARRGRARGDRRQPARAVAGDRRRAAGAARVARAGGQRRLRAGAHHGPVRDRVRA